MTKAKIEGQEITAIIDMGCLRVIILKECMSSLGLEADAEIDFMLNTADGTIKKKFSI